MKVYLNQYNSAHEHNMLPLAAGMLCAYSRSIEEINKHFEFEICILRENIDRALERIVDPYIVGFSCYLWNTNYSLILASKIKEKYPEVIIVFGGPSVPRKTPEVQTFLEENSFIDITAGGEGEITFSEILKESLKERDWSKIEGITYREADGVIKQNRPRPRVANLAQLPSPFLDGTFDEILSKYPDAITGAIWESNRGCPFSCTFCDWGQATESRVYSFEDQRVKDELDWISKKKIHYLFGADANFGMKRRDLDIAKYIAKLSQDSGCPGIFFINWTKNAFSRTVELAEILHNAGLATVITLSTQSNDPETLRINRRDNISLETYYKLKLEYHRRGISTYTDVLLGLPGETYDSFCAGLEKSSSPYAGDHISLNPVIMLPNAELGEQHYREKYQIKTRKVKGGMWRRILDEKSIPEYEEVIVATSSMSHADWRRSYIFGHMFVAFHDYKLLNCVIVYLHFHLGVSLKNIIEPIIDSANKENNCLFSIVSYLNSRLDQHDHQEQVVPVPGFEERRWNANDSVYLLASQKPEEFYSEVLSIMLSKCDKWNVSSDLLKDLLNYQKQLLPGVSPAREVSVEFRYNWKEFFSSFELGRKNLLSEVKNSLNFKCPEIATNLKSKEVAMLNLFKLAYSKGVQMTSDYKSL